MQKAKDQKHRGAHAELIASTWLLEQGYEVFRNVSAHGNIDLIGVKEGVPTYFDVKSYSNAAPGGPNPALSEQQIKLGVQAIYVNFLNVCFIDSKPRIKGSTISKPCRQCGVEFIAKDRRKKFVFCSRKCCQRWHVEVQGLLS